MSHSRSDFETAERLGRRRTRALPALAAIFVAQQATFLGPVPDLAAARTVDVVRVAAWVCLSLVLLAALWSNGFWFHSRSVRALLDDEVTRAHRGDAMSVGFLSAIVAAVALYIASMIGAVATREALHLVVTAGIATALLRFAFLERRAHRIG
jgi:hypothetical protein